MKKLIILIVAIFAVTLIGQFVTGRNTGFSPITPSQTTIPQTVTPAPTSAPAAILTPTPTITKPKLVPIRIRHEDE
jgi:hypothetical protein